MVGGGDTLLTKQEDFMGIKTAVYLFYWNFLFNLLNLKGITFLHLLHHDNVYEDSGVSVSVYVFDLL